MTYDVAIAYIGAFTFYILNVRLPQRRDRRNIYRHLAPIISRVVGEAENLMHDLNAAAGVDANRTNTWPNVENTCAQVNPATVREQIQIRMRRAREWNSEILKYPAYLATDLTNWLVDIEQVGYIPAYERYDQTGHWDSATDLRLIAREIFDYLQLADHVDDYRHAFLPTTFRRPPEFISASARGSDATPLWRDMDGTGEANPRQRWRWIRSKRFWRTVLLLLAVLVVSASLLRR